MRSLKTVLWAALLFVACAPLTPTHAGVDPVGQEFIYVDEFGDEFFLTGFPVEGEFGLLVDQEIEDGRFALGRIFFLQEGPQFISDIGEGDPDFDLFLPSGPVEQLEVPEFDFLITSGRNAGTRIRSDEFGEVTPDLNPDTGAEGTINEAGTRFTAVGGSPIASGNVILLENTTAERIADAAQAFQDAVDAWRVRLGPPFQTIATGETGEALRRAIDRLEDAFDDLDLEFTAGNLTRSEANQIRRNLNTARNNALRILFAPRFGKIKVGQVLGLIQDSLRASIRAAEQANRFIDDPIL